MSDPAAEVVWVREDVVRAVHLRQLAEHGGGEGVRDEGLLCPGAAAKPAGLRRPPARPGRAGRLVRLRHRAQPPLRGRQQADGARCLQALPAAQRHRRDGHAGGEVRDLPAASRRRIDRRGTGAVAAGTSGWPDAGGVSDATRGEPDTGRCQGGLRGGTE